MPGSGSSAGILVWLANTVPARARREERHARRTAEDLQYRRAALSRCLRPQIHVERRRFCRGRICTSVRYPTNAALADLEVVAAFRQIHRYVIGARSLPGLPVNEHFGVGRLQGQFERPASSLSGSGGCCSGGGWRRSAECSGRAARTRAVGEAAEQTARAGVPRLRRPAVFPSRASP